MCVKTGAKKKDSTDKNIFLLKYFILFSVAIKFYVNSSHIQIMNDDCLLDLWILFLKNVYISWWRESSCFHRFHQIRVLSILLLLFYVYDGVCSRFCHVCVSVQPYTECLCILTFFFRKLFYGSLRKGSRASIQQKSLMVCVQTEKK